MNKKFFIFILLSAFLLSSCVVLPPPTTENESDPVEKSFYKEERITKKPFGIKISPADSPVQPERFSGYHTGADFEVFEDEMDSDIEIHAICEGPRILSSRSTGYGGVVVQRCVYKGNDVTVVYGHLKFSSFLKTSDDILKKGQYIGILGEGFSEDTDGERKHLHLGVHKGVKINLLGYVQDESLLDMWIDPVELLSE